MVKGWSDLKWPGLLGKVVLAVAASGKAIGDSRIAANTKAIGDSAEDRALAHLQHHGLRLLQRNYRLAGGPRRHGAEIDLVMSAPDGTLVFVEVRARRSAAFGGAAASVGAAKQRRTVRAAQHYLMGLAVAPPCRFDVVVIDAGVLQWLPGAYDAG